MSWFNRGPIIKVNNSAIFTKNELRPYEFGQNAVAHGFKLGMGAYGDYMAQSTESVSDHNLRKLVVRNPGFLQLLFSNLISGGYYGFVRLMLKADEDVLSGIAEGIKSQLMQTMPPVAEKIVEDHKLIVIQFADALIAEVTDKEEDSSVKYFLHYAKAFYVPSLPADSSFDPIDLRTQLTGFGSRVMAFCQDYKLQLIKP